MYPSYLNILDCTECTRLKTKGARFGDYFKCLKIILHSQDLGLKSVKEKGGLKKFKRRYTFRVEHGPEGWVFGGIEVSLKKG